MYSSCVSMIPLHSCVSAIIWEPGSGMWKYKYAKLSESQYVVEWLCWRKCITVGVGFDFTTSVEETLMFRPWERVSS